MSGTIGRKARAAFVVAALACLAASPAFGQQGAAEPAAQPATTAVSTEQAPAQQAAAAAAPTEAAAQAAPAEAAAPVVKPKVQSIKVVASEGVPEGTPAAIAVFEQQFKESLYAKGGFVEGDQLTARFRYTAYNPGNRAMRYFVGFGAGKAEMSVEVTYIDANGVEVAKDEATGKMYMGAFGGGVNAPIRRAAKEAADYALKNFK
jgi:hypothetical protein